MRKKEGFTLIELLASVVILSVIMLVAVSSVNKALTKAKNKTYISDSEKIMHSAKALYNKDTTINEPTESTCVVFPIDSLELVTQTGPNNGEYIQGYSFVTINTINNKLVYRVQILEKYKNNKKLSYQGIPYSSNVNLNEVKLNEMLGGTKKDFLPITDLTNLENCKNGTITPTNNSFNLDPDKVSKVYYDFVSNGGESADIESHDYKYNDEVDLTPRAYKEGYEFVGWSARKNITKPLKEIYMQSNDMTLYAIFKKKHSSKFIYNEHDKDNDHTDKVKEVELSCYTYNREDSCDYKFPKEIKNSTSINNTKYYGYSNRYGDKKEIESLNSNAEVYYALYKVENIVTLKKGDNVINIDKDSIKCTGYSLYDGEKYNNPLCDVTLPNFTAKSGYKKYGYKETIAVTKTIKEQETVSVDKSLTLYALVRDDYIPKDIVLSKESDSTVSKSHTVTVTVEDDTSGLADTLYFKYGFSKTKTDEPTTYYEKEVNTKGEKKYSFDVNDNTLTGDYYLWVVPIFYVDKTGNANTKTKISNGTFKFNNDGTINLVESKVMSFDSNGNKIDINNTEFDTEMRQTIRLKLKVNSLVSDSIYNEDVFNKSKVYIGGQEVSGCIFTVDSSTNNVYLTIPETNKYFGSLSISVPKGAVSDASGNVTLAATLSPALTCVNITYSISYNLDGGSLSASNRTTYTKHDDTFTLNNPTKTNYEFLGWTGTNGSTPQTNITIPFGSTGIRNYTANWKLLKFNITINTDGGSISGAPTYYIAGTGTGYIPLPKKANYVFKGWTGTGLSSATSNVKVGTKSQQDISLKATWAYGLKTCPYAGSSIDGQAGISITYIEPWNSGIPGVTYGHDGNGHGGALVHYKCNYCGGTGYKYVATRNSDGALVYYDPHGVSHRQVSNGETTPNTYATIN